MKWETVVLILGIWWPLATLFALSMWFNYKTEQNL